MSEFDPQEIERVMRKIKHCMALSSSDNEHEAAAMRQAKKLMDKYRLSETDVKLSDVGSASTAPKSSMAVWERELSALVASAFNCRAYVEKEFNSARWRDEKSLMFVGVSPAQDVALYAFEALHLKLKTDRKAYVRLLKAGGGRPGRYSPETRGNHFASAWISGVANKVLALVPDVDETPDQAASNGRALAVSETKENELILAYMNQLTNGKGPGKAREGRMASPNATDLIAGLVSGQKAEVNHGLAQSGNESLALGVA